MSFVVHTTASEDRIRIIAAYSCLVMALIPLFNYNVMGIGLFIFLGVGLVIFAPFIRHSAQIHGALLAYIIFAGYDLCSFIWAPGSPDIMQYVKMIAYVLLIGSIIYSSGEIRLMLLFQIALGIIIVTILCITKRTMIVQTEYLTDTNRAILNIGGSQIDPNYASILFFPLSIYCVKVLIDRSKTIYKILASILIILCLYACLRSGTRGGLLAIVGGCAFYFIRSKGGAAKKISIIVAGVIIGYYLLPHLLELLPEDVQRRFTLIKILASGGAGRTEIWKACMSGVGDSAFTFLFGHGKGAVITNIGIASHNFFLDEIYNGGVIELILLLVFEASLYKKAKRNSNSFVLALLFANILISLTVSVGANMYFWTNILLCMLMGDVSEDELTIKGLLESFNEQEGKLNQSRGLHVN